MVIRFSLVLRLRRNCTKFQLSAAAALNLCKSSYKPRFSNFHGRGGGGQPVTSSRLLLLRIKII